MKAETNFSKSAQKHNINNLYQPKRADGKVGKYWCLIKSSQSSWLELKCTMYGKSSNVTRVRICTVARKLDNNIGKTGTSLDCSLNTQIHLRIECLQNVASFYCKTWNTWFDKWWYGTENLKWWLLAVVGNKNKLQLATE